MGRRVVANLVFLIAMTIAQATLASVTADARIGLIVWDEDSRFLDCEKGVQDQLKNDGYGEPGLKITRENVRGSKSRLAEVVAKFAAAKHDLIISLGTIPTIAITKAIKDVPVVFGMVYDPVEAGIARSWKSSGNNTTGASPLIPMSTLIGTLREVKSVKTLAVLYTADERQSRIQMSELKKFQADSQINVIPVILSGREEIAKTLPAVVREVDAIYVTGATRIGSAVSEIVKLANDDGVVTITHLPDYVNKGVLIGVCANSYYVGRLTGKKAAQVLKGAKPSAVPVETEKRVDVILNRKTMAAGRFQLPAAFLQKVTKTVE